MIGMSLKALFTPRQPIQQPTATPPCTPGALRGFLVQCRAHAGKMITTLADSTAVPGLAITGMSDIDPSQIHPKDIDRCAGWGHSGFDLDVDCVGAIPVLAHLPTGGLLPTQLPALVITEMEPETHPPMQQGETDGPVTFSERENPLVILDRGERKGRDGVAVSLSRFAVRHDTPKGSLRQIGRQPKRARTS